MIVKRDFERVSSMRMNLAEVKLPLAHDSLSKIDSSI